MADAITAPEQIVWVSRPSYSEQELSYISRTAIRRGLRVEREDNRLTIEGDGAADFGRQVRRNFGFDR